MVSDDMKVEFLDLDSPEWSGLYRFVLTLGEQKFGGAILVRCVGKRVDKMAVTLGKRPELNDEEQERVGDFITGEFEKVQKISYLERKGE